jgi:hypothetical protein
MVWVFVFFGYGIYPSTFIHGVPDAQGARGAQLLRQGRRSQYLKWQKRFHEGGVFFRQLLFFVIIYMMLDVYRPVLPRGTFRPKIEKRAKGALFTQ